MNVLGPDPDPDSGLGLSLGFWASGLQMQASMRQYNTLYGVELNHHLDQAKTSLNLTELQEVQKKIKDFNTFGSPDCDLKSEAWNQKLEKKRPFSSITSVPRKKVISC